MKKILSFMFAVLMCLSAFPVRAAAAGEEAALGQKSRVNLSTASENGWRIEPATEEEIARAIAANKGITYEEAFSEVVSKRKSRAQYDNFRIYNIYEVAIDEPNVTLTSFTHNVYVQMYASGSFMQILDVYESSVCVLPLTGVLSWEAGSNYVMDWGMNYIEFFSSGNATYTSAGSVAGTLSGVVSVSIGTNYYYRLYREFTTRRSY